MKTSKTTAAFELAVPKTASVAVAVTPDRSVRERATNALKSGHDSVVPSPTNCLRRSTRIRKRTQDDGNDCLAAAFDANLDPSEKNDLDLTASRRQHSNHTAKFTASKRNDKQVVVNHPSLTLPTPTSTPPSKRRKRKSEKQTTCKQTVSQSYGPLQPCSFPSLAGKGIQPHTLILGTHPSIQSLQQKRYYGHPMNAFWWIAGDCLGFRRDTGISPVTQVPYKFTSALRYGDDRILPYEEQLERFVSQGFCLWDLVQQCSRLSTSSLDQDIRDETPNNIRKLVEEYPSIRRIVFANGVSGVGMFAKHFNEWLLSGKFKAAEDPFSQSSLGKFFRRRKPKKGSKGTDSDDEQESEITKLNEPSITLVAAISVSPAAARYSYEEKRDFWERHVYSPGLADFSESDSTT